jgi:2-dehydro-3-deoxygluconokinase
MLMPLKIRPKENCRWDLASLGEVMLRLDPGDRRVFTTRHFEVWEGGGEYNVARALKRCFGMHTAIVTAFADNPIGRLIEDLIYQGGVDQSLVKWVEFDGVGRTVRNGLNFTDRGFGMRAAAGCYDRGHTAVSQLKPGDIDWDEIFGKHRARWFHTGGIFSALSPTTAEVAIEAMKAARRHGAIVSYDLNYRASLWKNNGGRAKAQELDCRMASLVDVMFGIPGMDDSIADLGPDGVRATIEQAARRFGFSVLATTLRRVKTASCNDWGAICYCDGEFYESAHWPDLDIYDRVGGGDGFSSGLIYGLMSGQSPQWAVECGAAHGALAMTTPGDLPMVTLAEVEHVMKGGCARIAR